MREQKKQEKTLGADAAAVDSARSAEAVPQRSHDAPKFTPGPWGVSSLFIVCTPDAEIVARTEPFTVPTLCLSFDECVANAHLISAAPDLYEALKELIGYASETIDGLGIRYAFDARSPLADRIRAALTKAEGRS